MINCLFDYIGLQDVTTPISGKYLNRLQGIDTQQLELIRNEGDTYNIEDAWDDIQNRAIDEFEQRLQEWGAKFYRNRSYTSNIVTGQYDEDNAIVSTNNLAGWKVDGSFGYYKNMKLVIQDVKIYTTNSANSSIKIYNASTGDLLDEISHAFLANQINTVPILKSYAAWEYPRLFICYDESEIQTIQASDLFYQYTFSTSQGRIAKGSPVKYDNISGVGSGGQGMIMTYNIDCSLDNWVCQRRDLFTTPFMYLLGYEFCQERLYSDRINRYTLLNRDRARELADYFLQRFNTQIEETLNALTIDFGSDFCFKCDREVNYKTQLP